MANYVLPFLMSMLLGRTIDLTSYTISGNNVFDDADYDETPVKTVNTTYNVIQGDAFPYTYFGIPADIVLRIKTNFLSSSSGAMGLDGILKDTSWKYNSVVVSVTTVYRTVDRTLKQDASPIQDWQDRVPTSQTHYAKSLFYGGWAVVLFQFKCDIPGDVVAVRKVLTRHLGVVGSLTENTLEKWKAAEQDILEDTDIRGEVHPQVHVYSTSPFKSSITTPESLFESIKSFPEQVGLLGQPLFMNLYPLSELDKSYNAAQENIELLTELEQLDIMFDDVKSTKTRIMKWTTDTMTLFDDDEEEKISNLLEHLNDCIRSFTHLGSEVSLFKHMDRNLLNSVFQKYQSGLEKGLATYNLLFRQLKEKIDADCTRDFLHKIRGLLRVYENDVHYQGRVEGGLLACMEFCTTDKTCRSIGYAEKISELDLNTGLYVRKEKQCWTYSLSSSTATVYTPNGMSGDVGIYDRVCY